MEDQQARDSLHQELNMYTPSHPLPMEIQQMEQAETTCCYCGVSYLILHEFQRLQDHLTEVERELETERGSAKREKEAREQLKHSHVQLDELRAAQKLHLERMKVLELQVSLMDRELVDARVVCDRKRAELKTECSHSLQLRTVCQNQRGVLHKALSMLQCCAAQLHGAKQELTLISQHWNANRALVLHYCTTLQTELVGQQQKLGRAKAEQDRLQQEVQKLQENLDASQLDMQRMDGHLQNQELLQMLNRKAQFDIQALKQEVATLQEELKKSRCDREHVERLLESRQKEEEEMCSQQQQLSDKQSATILSLSQNLREKETNLLSCQQLCESLQQQLLMWKQKEAETRQELEGALSMGQKIRHERDDLKRTQKVELQKLEQTFKKRLELAKEQSSKLSSVLHSDVQNLKEEVSALEEQLRKREEEVHRVQEDSLQREDQLLQEIQAENKKLQCKVQQHQQVALKLQQALRDVQLFKEENTTLHKENGLLQETVRRECEERAELTAALSLAREQLLGIRQAALSSSESCSSLRSSLPSLSPGPSRGSVIDGRSTASWNGSSRQTVPTLPRLDSERAGSVSTTRQRISMGTGRKDKRRY